MARSNLLRPRLFTKGLIVIATLAAAGYALKAAGLGGMLDTAWIDAEIRGRGLSGEALYVLVGALAVAVGVPRQLVSFLGGYAFGFAEGIALALLSTVIGCVLTFSYARLLGRDLVMARFAKRIRRLDEFLRDHPFSMALLIRLLPVGSNLLTNLLAGVSSAAALPFILGSAIGFAPQTAVFALLGSGVKLDGELRIGLSVILFLAATAIGVHLFQRYRRGPAFDDAVAEVIEDDPAPAREGAG